MFTAMFEMSRRRRGRKNTTGFTFNGDQLLFTFPKSAGAKNSRRTTISIPEGPPSPPPTKKRRMQVETQTTAPVRSVGQRLKEAACKDGFRDPKHTAAILRSPQPVAIRPPPQPVRTLPQLSDFQKNTVRIIGQYLGDLGLRDTVDVLVQETGTRLENSLATRLRDCVERGLWNKALDIVDKMSEIATERQCKMLRVLFLEEKFRELLRLDQPVMAVRLLQVDYPKWKVLNRRRRYFTQMVVSCNSKTEPPPTVEQQKLRSKQLLARIHLILPLNFILPPARLDRIFNQAWKYQIAACGIHISRKDLAIRPESLIRDHHCTLSNFPVYCTQTLRDHGDEVWSVAFAPCGKLMASGTRNGQVAIWDIHPVTLKMKMIKQMSMGGFGMVSASALSWSADSRFLAATGAEDNRSGIVVFNIPMGSVESTVRCDRGETFSCVSFGNSENYSVACADQKGHFYYVDIKRPHPASNSFEGYRIRSVYCMKDGKTLLAADTHNRIRSYRIDTNDEHTLIQEYKTIICFTVDRRENYVLVAAKAEGLRLWDLRSRQLVRSFFGSIHGEYVIYPAFGGSDQDYIACGSEDNNVVVWSKERENPIAFLSGHKAMVNAVSWNPYYHHMLASASDDGTIKIWGPEPKKKKKLQQPINHSSHMP